MVLRTEESYNAVQHFPILGHTAVRQQIFFLPGTADQSSRSIREHLDALNVGLMIRTSTKRKIREAIMEFVTQCGLNIRYDDLQGICHIPIKAILESTP